MGSVSDPIKSIKCKPQKGFMEKMFGPSENQQKQYDMEVIVKLTTLAQLFNTDPEHFVAFVE